MKTKYLQQINTKRIILLLSILSFVAFKTWAYDFSAVCSTGQTLYYSITDAINHEVKLTYPCYNNDSENPDYWYDYPKPTGDIIFPTTVEYNNETYTVTMVGDRAFFACSGLTGDLVIPNTVKSIELAAFSGGCTGFTGHLTIPNTVTTIARNAFRNCSGLVGELYIPNSVVSIKELAFGGCKNLSSIVVSDDNTVYDSRDNCNAIIETASNTLIAGCMATVIPNSVTTIGQCAFYDCSGLTGNLVIPNSVTTIENSAFRGCNGLNGTLTLPNSLTTLGESAFYECVGFTGDIVIPNSVTSIERWIFYGCSGFNGTLTLPNSVTSIKKSAFCYCTGLIGNLSIPNSVTSIDEYAFDSCYGFTGNLVLPNELTSLGECAFYECTGFTGNLVIPNSITQFGQAVFYNCSGFSGDLIIPNSLTSIGNYGFRGCSGLNGTLIIPNSVTSIGNYAFALCSGLNGTLTLPNSLTWLGAGAFYGCSGFTGELVIPNSVISIDDYTFYECSGLSSVVIPSSVVDFGFESFQSCSNLSAVHYQGTIAQWCGLFFGSAYNNPLFYAHNLYINNSLVENLIIPNTVTSIESFAFFNATSIKTVIFGNSLEDIGHSAFCNCTSLTSPLVFPKSVNSIDYTAFSGCSGLTSITVKSNTPPICHGSSFSGYDPNIPIYVPCGTIDLYRFSDGWNQFSNYNEFYSMDLEVASADETMGEAVIIQMHSTLCDGDHTAIVMATANEGYVFDKWTFQNEVVSTDSIYSFIVNEDTRLVANFRESNHWIPNTAPYQSTATIIGTVSIDGIEQRSATIEVGAFYGDDCCGSQLCQYLPKLGRYLVYLTLYGYASNPVTFKLYDHAIGRELPVVYTGNYTFVVDDIVGTPTNPHILEFETNPPQRRIFIGSESDHLWSTASNWEGDEVPYDKDTIFINGNCQQDMNFAAGCLTINSECSLIVMDGVILTAEDLYSTNVNNLIIEDGGQLYTTTNNIVKATIKKNISGYDTNNKNWYLIAPSAYTSSQRSISTNTVGMINGSFDLYSFDMIMKDREWQNHKKLPLNYLNVGCGYLYANQANTILEFAGTLVTSDSETIALGYDENEPLKSYNLVGNPFPCNAFIERSYYRLNDSHDSLVESRQTIAPGEAVFVKTHEPNETVTFTRQSFDEIPEGIINGRFTINENGDKVYFSKGNLQYIGSISTPYWKFADHQWDYLGNNGQGSTSQIMDRDLFGWGTSGYNNGAYCYQPWSTNTNNDNYNAYGNQNYDLNDQTNQADWGYNPIRNGGNLENQWRVLTGGSNGEWNYIVNTRVTTSGIRYAKAVVNGVNGVILVPDNWNASCYSLNNTNQSTASFNCNIISSYDWENTLEVAGCVFLPAAGDRGGTTTGNIGAIGNYWSSTHEGNSYACSLYFNANIVYPERTNGNRYYGMSVRLVRVAD